MTSSRILKQHWSLILAVLLYVILAYSLNFTQDDAYISYRYVANYLNGHGLVYNIGERIEGFTNFGWTAFLLLVGVLGETTSGGRRSWARCSEPGWSF